MNWVTVVLVAVLALLTWRAYRNGFVRELVSLTAAVLAVPVAGVLYPQLYPKVLPMVDNEVAAKLVSFLAIFAGVIVGGQVVAFLIKRAVNALNLGAADQVSGALFGFVKAVVICQVLLIAFVAFPSPDLTETIDQSPVAGALLDSAPLTRAVLPDRVDHAVGRFLDGLPAGLDGDEGPTPTATPRATATPSP